MDPATSIVVDKPEAAINYDPYYYKSATVKILHFNKSMDTKEVMSFVKKEFANQGQVVGISEKLFRQNSARTSFNFQRGRKIH